MPNDEEKEWQGSKGFWICIWTEILLVVGAFLWHQLSEPSEQYSGFWSYVGPLLLTFISTCFIIFCLQFLFYTKISSAIIILLSIFLFIIEPITEEKWQCYDRTTYDNDFSNDVKCINKHGEVKRMEYEEVREFAPETVDGWDNSDISILNKDKDIYNLINEHMYDMNGNCNRPYNIFDKERDAYYGYELEKKLSKLEAEGKEMDTDLDDWPHSLDFRFGERYAALSELAYNGCLNGCGPASDSKEYYYCILRRR